MDKENDWNECLKIGGEITRNAFKQYCHDGVTPAEKNLTRYKQLSEPELIEPDRTDFLDNLVERSESNPAAWDSLIRIENYLHTSGVALPVPLAAWRIDVNNDKSKKKPGLKQSVYGQLFTTDKPGVLQQIGTEEHKVAKHPVEKFYRDMAVITAIVDIIKTLAKFDIKATRNDASDPHSAADVVVMELKDTSVGYESLTYRAVKDIWDKANDKTNWQYGFRLHTNIMSS